jgi:hypothetical protein
VVAAGRLLVPDGGVLGVVLDLFDVALEPHAATVARSRAW